MSQIKLDKFLEDVLSYIKFPFVKNDIKAELEIHILDKMDYYMNRGYSKVEAEELAVKDMGDPKEIGIGLNKQHNPILGWMLKITNVLAVMVMCISIYFLVPSLAISISNINPIEDIPKENIEYQIDLDEQVKIDHRIINLTNIVYEKNGNMNIIYNDREKGLFLGGWGFGHIGNVYDDSGNQYLFDSGRSTTGIKNKTRMTIENFPEEADELIIDYDQYNRKFRIEISLKAGDNHE